MTLELCRTPSTLRAVKLSVAPRQVPPELNGVAARHMIPRDMIADGGLPQGHTYAAIGEPPAWW